MPIIPILMTLVVLGLVLYLVNLLPLDETIKRLIHVVVIVLIVLWLLQVILGGGGFSMMRLC